MEFKAIETQEDLEVVIKDRLKREREKVEKECEEKYSDYETLKQSAKDFEKDKKDLESEIKELNKTAKTVEELTNKNKLLETDSLKVKIAVENGIPLNLAGRLKGEDEKSIKEDALAMAKFVTKKHTPPLRNPEVEHEKEDEAYRNILKNLKEEEE